MNKQNLNLGSPLSQGGSHAVMPSLGHGTGLPYREGETPARAPINIQGIGGSQIRQKPLSGQLRKGNWSYSLCSIEPLKPRVFLGSRREPRCPRKASSKVASA